MCNLLICKSLPVYGQKGRMNKLFSIQGTIKSKQHNFGCYGTIIYLFFQICCGDDLHRRDDAVDDLKKNPSDNNSILDDI